MLSKITQKRYQGMQNNLILFILFLGGLLFKLYGYFIGNKVISSIGDFFIITLSAGLLVGIYLQRKEDLVLREVLGLRSDNNLLNSIHSMIREEEYLTEDRNSIWKLIPAEDNQMGIIHEDIHIIRVIKDDCDFYFRRGYDENKYEIKDILIKKEENKEFHNIDCSKEFNQHLLKQKHGSHLCYTLTNLNFIKNLKYLIKIKTVFNNCMDYNKDYISIDFLNSTSSAHIIVKFPFELKKKNGRIIYHIDVKVRSLTKFRGYIEYKIKKGTNRKNNILDILYNKHLEGGDSIVVFYKKVSN